MKCPACFNQLSSTTVGKLTVDVCRGGCGGIWFDAFELQQVDEPRESTGEWLIHIERDPKLRVDFSRKRACPKCDGVNLKRRHFSAKRRERRKRRPPASSGLPRRCFATFIRCGRGNGCSVAHASSVQVARLPGLAIQRGKDAAEPARKMRALLSICQGPPFAIGLSPCQRIGIRR